LILGLALPMFVLAIVIGAVAWFAANNRPVNSLQLKQVFTVESGQSVEQIGANLQQAGLIRSRKVFVIRARLSRRPIPAGSHFLSSNETTTEVLRDLQNLH
jgi:cell division protein YceG involved in septum cleavage